jgi:hypothetical protein
VKAAYLCATPKGPVPFDPKGLLSCLPVTRSGGQAGITYGSYLDAVKSFLIAHQSEFRKAASRRLSSASQNISEINIIAESMEVIIIPPGCGCVRVS